jgi:hypothetical protein
MRRSVLMTLALLATLALAPGRALACSCAPPANAAAALAQVEVVFSGRLVAMPPTMGEVRQEQIAFQAQRFWKGQPRGQVVLKTVRNGMSCEGYFWELGQEYLVYAHRQQDGTLGVHLCSRTSELARAGADLADLGPGVAVVDVPVAAPEQQPAEGGGLGWGIILLSLLGLLIAGALIGMLLGRRAGRKKK